MVLGVVIRVTPSGTYPFQAAGAKRKAPSFVPVARRPMAAKVFVHGSTHCITKERSSLSGMWRASGSLDTSQWATEQSVSVLPVPTRSCRPDSAVAWPKRLTGAANGTSGSVVWEHTSVRWETSGYPKT